VVLVFDERLDEVSAVLANYTIMPGAAVSQAEAIGPAFREVVLTFSTPLEEGVLYTINIGGITDCSGNAIAGNNTAQFGIPLPSAPGDVLINELLYEPRTGGSDFVELYNHSSKILSLQNWQLGNEADGVPGNGRTIVDVPLLLLPGEFVVCTTNPANIRQEYPMGRFETFLSMDLLNYPNSGGSVVLFNELGQVIDLFRYDSKLHFPLLSTTRGVSLERVSYDVPAISTSNWTSASEQSGFATPGYRNSQYVPLGMPVGDFLLNPKVFSPDNDGVDDVLFITYSLDQSDYVGNIRVYDERGRIIRSLYNNYLLGVEGTLRWDGTTDKGEKAPVGMYIIYIEVFNPSGQVRSFKRVAVLGGRF